MPTRIALNTHHQSQSLACQGLCPKVWSMEGSQRLGDVARRARSNVEITIAVPIKTKSAIVAGLIAASQTIIALASAAKPKRSAGCPGRLRHTISKVEMSA